MIYDKDDFEVKYWGGDYVAFNEEFEAERKPTRSIKKKLFISLFFVIILATAPAIVYGALNINLPTSKKVVSINPDTTPKKTVNQNSVDYKNPTATPTKSPIQTIEVINNDSYWKIAKRACGTGKNYLSVRDQNNGKALRIGDSVVVNCSL